MQVYTPSRSGKLGRKVHIPSLDKVWYVFNSKKLSPKIIFSREKDIGEAVDKHKAYTVEEICEYARNNNLRVIRQFNILMFEEIKND